MCGNLWWIPPEKECDRDKKCVKKMPFTKHGGQGNEMTNTQVQDAATAPFRTLWGTARGKPLGLISPWFWSKNQGENSPDLGREPWAVGALGGGAIPPHTGDVGPAPGPQHPSGPQIKTGAGCDRGKPTRAWTAPRTGLTEGSMREAATGTSSPGGLNFNPPCDGPGSLPSNPPPPHLPANSGGGHVGSNRLVHIAPAAQGTGH